MIAEESISDPQFQHFSPERPLYECRAVLMQEDDGYSVYASRLPGVHSQGATETEAIENIKQAYLGVLEAYHEREAEIPWRDAFVDPNGKEVWVLVNG